MQNEKRELKATYTHRGLGIYYCPYGLLENSELFNKLFYKCNETIRWICLF